MGVERLMQMTCRGFKGQGIMGCANRAGVAVTHELFMSSHIA